MNFGTFGFPKGSGLNFGLFGFNIIKPLWTPANISTQLWLDAANSATLTNILGNISQWNDQSGNNRHVLQVNASERPLYAANGLNGLPSLTFDGVDDYLTVGVINTQSTNTSTFIVSQPSSTSVRGNTFKNGDANGYGIGYGSSTSDNFGNNFIYIREAIQWHPASSYGGTLPNIVSSILGSSDIVNYLNGTNIQTISGIPIAPSGGTHIGGQRRFSGNISEVIFCSSALSTTDRQKIEGYLAYKWGLIDNLPSDHTYKTVPPYI